LENTLETFKNKNINISGYQDNPKLFVIASVLDYNPPVVKMPVEKITSINAQIRNLNDW